MRLLLRSQSDANETSDIVLYQRLEKSLPTLKGGSCVLPDFTREEIYGDYECYYLIPRLKAQPNIEALGYSFSLYYERYRDSEKNRDMIRVYAITRGHPEKLLQSFELETGDPLPKKYVVDIIPKSEKAAIYFEYIVDRGVAAAFNLPADTALLFSVNMNAKLKNVLMKKAGEIRKKDSAGTTKPIEDKLSGEPVLVAIRVFANDRKTAKECGEMLKRLVPAPASKSVRRIKNPESFYKLILPPKMPRFSRRIPNASYRTILKLPLLPTAGMEGVEYTRYAKMPAPEEISRGPILLGKVENRPFSLDPSDLFRHAYIVGGTGSGKTNLLKLLIKNLHDNGYPVFVIDPHGELSSEMACVISDAVYLHPVESPFGFNPFELPTLKDRNQQILMSVDELMNLFTNVFHLPETAMNVRYILQTVTRQIYKHGGIPTLAGLYKIVTAIYNGHDVGITDQQFKEEEKALRNMPDQSFISTLSRLQSFATDKLLMRITSTTTIDMGKFIEEKKTVFFALPQRHIGLTASTLLASTILLKIYYTKLIRVDEKSNEHVFVVIDEFQTLQSLPILATILSEARKFGLHLIIAHQYLDQLTEDVRQAAITNAGVKFIFNVSGKDVEQLATVDPAFDRELKSIIGSLPTGHCIVKLTSRAQDEALPPMVLQVNEFSETPVRTLEEARTEDFVPPEVSFTFELVNPVFRFIDPPFSMSQKIIQAILGFKGSASINDISGATGYKPDSVSKVVSMMVSKGWLEKETKKDRTNVRIASGFFDQFYSVSPSEEGRKLIDHAVIHYLGQGYYVTPTKNVNTPRPDLICIPYDGYYLDFRNAIEVEIEATTVSRNPELLVETMKKNTPFKERHVWCSPEAFPTVLEYARKYANKKTVVIAPGGNDLLKEVVYGFEEKEEVDGMLGRKKDIKIPDSGVENSFVEELETEESEAEVQVAQVKTHNMAANPKPAQQKVSPALVTKLRWSLGKELFEKVRAQGLYEELASIVASKNMSKEEIVKTALDLLKRGEEQTQKIETLEPQQTPPQAIQSSIADRLTKLNPNVSKKDAEEIFMAFMERIEKIFQLGFNTEETRAFVQEICANIDDVLSLLYGDETDSELSSENETSVKVTPGLPATEEQLTPVQSKVQVPSHSQIQVSEKQEPATAATQKQPEIESRPSTEAKIAEEKTRGKSFMKKILHMGKEDDVVVLEGRRVRVLGGSPALLSKLLSTSGNYILYSKSLNKKIDRISNAPPGNYALEIQNRHFDIHIE
jgi:hypothetical protein